MPTCQGARAAGDGAFLNAARLTASTAPFRCDASYVCWALPRPAAPALLSHKPSRLGLRYRLMPIGALPAPGTSLTSSISVVRNASAPNRSPKADAPLKSTISPASLRPLTLEVGGFIFQNCCGHFQRGTDTQLKMYPSCFIELFYTNSPSEVQICRDFCTSHVSH